MCFFFFVRLAHPPKKSEWEFPMLNVYKIIIIVLISYSREKSRGDKKNQGWILFSGAQEPRRYWPSPGLLPVEKGVRWLFSNTGIFILQRPPLARVSVGHISPHGPPACLTRWEFESQSLSLETLGVPLRTPLKFLFEPSKRIWSGEEGER